MTADVEGRTLSDTIIEHNAQLAQDVPAGNQYEIGDKISVADDEVFAIYRDATKDAHAAFEAASRWMRVTRERLWEHVDNAYKDARGFQKSVSDDGKSLLILRKL